MKVSALAAWAVAVACGRQSSLWLLHLNAARDDPRPWSYGPMHSSWAVFSAFDGRPCCPMGTVTGYLPDCSDFRSFVIVAAIVSSQGALGYWAGS